MTTSSKINFPVLIYRWYWARGYFSSLAAVMLSDWRTITDTKINKQLKIDGKPNPTAMTSVLHMTWLTAAADLKISYK